MSETLVSIAGLALTFVATPCAEQVMFAGMYRWSLVAA